MSEFPDSTSYYGFDINLSQVPPEEWLPRNLSFSKLDLEEELPEELEGGFDIVNVRLLLLVVKNDDATVIWTKLSRMPKPGGWLQWTEADSTTRYLDFVKAKPHLTGSAMVAMRSGLSGHDTRFQPKWPLKLPGFFEAAGFGHVQEDRKVCGDYLPWLALSNDTITAVYQELIGGLPLGSKRDELERLYGQAAQESRDGTAWNTVRLNVLGQKPQSVMAE